MLHFKEYTRVNVRNNFTVSYLENDYIVCFGIIHYYVIFEPVLEYEENQIFAIITKLTAKNIIAFPNDDVFKHN